MKKLVLIVVAAVFIFSSSSISAVAEEEIEEIGERVEIAEMTEAAVDLSFPSYINEETLTEDYIASSLPSAHPVLRASRPSGLIQFPVGSANRNLYLALRREITGIANGTNEKQYNEDIDGLSTVFSIPAADIFGSTSFSASDLEVDNLFTEDSEVSEAAEAAFWSQVEEMRTSISFPDVALCIVNDSPYELYWFGRMARVVGNSFEMEPGNGVLELVGDYRVLFSVSADYAVSGEETVIDGTIYRTWVDTDKFGSVTRATKAINTIRAAVAGMSDEQKMAYFAEQICERVSYNYEAEAEFKAGTREYGDPWQLVWVFDNRSEQKVVCEGYSKAFAYLCELCTREAEAIIVWGSIPGGNHMWNVVNVAGHNYLVDLTNYDLGYDLFMVGADGSVADGYDTKALKGYVYNRVQTKRSDEELRIEAYSYAEWKTATTEAPIVQISSDRTYPGYQVAIRAESVNNALPVDQIVVHKGEESEELEPENGIVLIILEQDTEISIAAVVDGITTPAAEAVVITVAEEPETVFSLPAGSRVEDEAFSGIAAELVQVNGNDVEEEAFDSDVVLAVDGDWGDWFDSGYRFVVTVPAGEK